MFRLIVALITALSLVACTSMQTVRSTDQKTLQAAVKVGDEVSVAAINGKTYLLVLTAVDDEKIVGIGDNKKVTIRYNQIQSLEVRKVSTGKTIGLTVGVVAGIVTTAIIVGALLVANAFKHLGDDSSQ